MGDVVPKKKYSKTYFFFPKKYSVSIYGLFWPPVRWRRGGGVTVTPTHHPNGVFFRLFLLSLKILARREAKTRGVVWMLDSRCGFWSWWVAGWAAEWCPPGGMRERDTTETQPRRKGVSNAPIFPSKTFRTHLDQIIHFDFISSKTSTTCRIPLHGPSDWLTPSLHSGFISSSLFCLPLPQNGLSSSNEKTEEATPKRSKSGYFGQENCEAKRKLYSQTEIHKNRLTYTFLHCRPARLIS